MIFLQCIIIIKKRYIIYDHYADQKNLKKKWNSKIFLSKININDLTKKIAPFQFAIGKIFGETAKMHWFSSKGFGWLSSGTKTVIEKNNIDQYSAVSFVINLDRIKINPEERCLIKIDVEGFETEVFLGATNLLKSKPNIMKMF